MVAGGKIREQPAEQRQVPVAVITGPERGNELRMSVDYPRRSFVAMANVARFYICYSRLFCAGLRRFALSAAARTYTQNGAAFSSYANLPALICIRLQCFVGNSVVVYYFWATL